MAVSLESSKVVSENTSSTQVCVSLSTTGNTRRSYAVQLTTEDGTAIGKVASNKNILCVASTNSLPRGIIPLNYLRFVN